MDTDFLLAPSSILEHFEHVLDSAFISINLICVITHFLIVNAFAMINCSLSFSIRSSFFDFLFMLDTLLPFWLLLRVLVLPENTSGERIIAFLRESSKENEKKNLGLHILFLFPHLEKIDSFKLQLIRKSKNQNVKQKMNSLLSNKANRKSLSGYYYSCAWDHFNL